MKKIASLISVILLCLVASMIFVACNEGEHVHTYSSEWLTDESHHWHSCEGNGCSESSDKAEHIWNDGEITNQATVEADGLKTYTCTVCSKTKTEVLKYEIDTTVDETEWKSALATQNFYNVTLKGMEYWYNFETNDFWDDTSYYDFKYDGDKMEITRKDGTSRVMENSGDMDSEEVAEIVGFGLNYYSEFNYDEEQGIYSGIIPDPKYSGQLGLTYEFVDGVLVRFGYYKVREETNNDFSKCDCLIWNFSDYGTTKIGA